MFWDWTESTLFQSGTRPATVPVRSLMLLLFTNKQSHTGFPLVPKSVTLNDPERAQWPLFCNISQKSVALRELHQSA